MEKTFKSIAINYGLYLGGLLSIFTIFGYALNMEILVNFWLMMLIIPVLIVIFGVYSTAKIKKLSDGAFTFKAAFSSYFITVAIGIMISTIVTVIIFNFIDPEAAIELKNIIVSKTETFMKSMGAPLETIAEEIDKMEKQDTFALSTQLKSLAQSLVVFSIIGLIVAVIMKRSDPDA